MAKKPSQEMNMDASYPGTSKPNYEDSTAESAEDLNGYYGADNSNYPSKPYYVANKNRGYTEYR